MAPDSQNTESLRVQLNALRALQTGGTAHLDAAIRDVEEKIEQLCLQEQEQVLTQVPAVQAEEQAQVPVQMPEHEGKPPFAPVAAGAVDAQAGQDKGQSVPLVVATSRACDHNTWDNVRTKKGQVFLRCRLCDSQWRTPVDSLERCNLFNTPGGCPSGSECPQLHLHSRKQSLQERVALHGASVLERVPVGPVEGEEGSPQSAGAKQFEADMGQEEATVATVRPCNHNSWDNVRTKKGQVFLRCRDCESQWRTPVDELDRCTAFNAATGCLANPCNQLHLHARKQSLAERLAKHGTGILEKVPGPEQAGGCQYVLQKIHGGSIGMNVKGNVVTKVEGESPAAYAGVQEGSVILGINQRQVGNATKEVVAVMREAWTGGSEMKIIMKPPQQPQQPLPHHPPYPPHGDMPGAPYESLSDVISISTKSSAMPTTPQHPTPPNAMWGQQVWQQPVPAPMYAVPQDAQSACSGSSYGAAVDITLAIQKKYQTEPLGLSVKRDLVTKVVVGSPANIAGVAEGMQIVMVNSAPVGSTTNEVVAMIRHAWQCSSLMHITVRTPGSTAPPPLEPSISDVMSESQGSRPHTPRTMTHSPYAVEAPPQSGPIPPMLHNIPGAKTQPHTTTIEVETLVVIRKHEATTFGAAVKGNRVSKVAPGSAAAAAGIYEGMHILSVNGKPVEKTTLAVVTAMRGAWKTDEPYIEVVVRGVITKTTRPPEWQGDNSSVSTGAMSVSEGSSNWHEVYSLPDDSGNSRLPCVATVTVGGTALIWPALDIKEVEGDAYPGWHDRNYELFNLPPCLHEAVLYQPPHKDVPAGTLHSVYLHQECDMYLAYSNALGRDGGFPGCMEVWGWEKVEEAPEWRGSPVAALGMSMWRVKVRKGETVALPTTKTAQSTFCVFLVKTSLGDDEGSLPNMSFSTYHSDDVISAGRLSRQLNASTPTPSLPDDCSANGDQTPRSTYSAGGTRSLTVPPSRKTRKRSSTGTKLTKVAGVATTES